jgi:hypothetical protein
MQGALKLNWQLALLAAAIFAQSSAAQVAAPQSAAQPASEQGWADEAARLAIAEANSYEIRVGDEAGPQLQLVEKPVLKWSNTHDATIHGSVLVWMHAGRPEAIASIFKYFTGKDEFSAELHSLAEQPLVAKKGGTAVWQPAEAGVKFAPLEGAPAPARTASSRLVQMRGIAREFSGEMTTFDQTTHPLRLLPQPLVRYAGDAGRPVDGAIFAFARATDPDVLLVLEIRDGKGAEPEWQYALARMHCGALAVSYQKREVWTAEQMVHPFARPKGVYTLLQSLPEPIAAKTGP